MKIEYKTSNNILRYILIAFNCNFNKFIHFSLLIGKLVTEVLISNRILNSLNANTNFSIVGTSPNVNKNWINCNVKLAYSFFVLSNLLDIKYLHETAAVSYCTKKRCPWCLKNIV